MGFLKGFVNREEPFLIQFALLTTVGLWYIDSDRKWARFLYAVYRFFVFFSLTSLLFIEIIDMLMLGEDSSKLAERVCAAGITAIIAIRSHMMLRSASQFYEIENNLEQFKRMRAHRPQELEMIERASEEITRLVKLFYAVAALATFFWSIHPILYEDRKQLPYPIRLPIDMEKSPNYEILYVFIVIILLIFTASVVSTALRFGTFLTIIITHFGVVQRNLEEIAEEREEVVRRERFLAEFNAGKLTAVKTPEERLAEEKKMKDARTMEILIDAIRTQIHIYDEVDRFKSLQSDHLMVHILGIVFGLAVVETTGLNDEFTVHLVKRLLIMGLGISDIFTICFFGEHLSQKSCELSEALYMVPWHEMDVTVQRVILIMSIRSRRPCVLKAGGTIRINLATFLNIMRVVYNIMLLFRHTVNT